MPVVVRFSICYLFVSFYLSRASASNLTYFAMPEFLEQAFENVGRFVARRPGLTIFFALVLIGACGGGYPMLKNENRAEKQWVPRGAMALDHKDYADGMWPSSQRFNFWIAKSKDGSNVMTAKYIQELNRIYKEIMAIEVSVEEVKDIHGISGKNKRYKWASVTDKQWEVFNGTWSFDRRPGTKRKCAKFGPFCGKSSPLEIFRQDDKIIEQLTDATTLQAFNFWESQTQMCPVTIARADSPCIDTSKWKAGAGRLDCQTYKTATQRQNCRDSANNYCNSTCPGLIPGPNCNDNGCISLRSFNNLAGQNNNNSAPESAFAFEPFKINTVASSGADGPVKSGGKYVSATAFFGFFAVDSTTVLVDGSEVDPVALEWEKRALCKLGISVNDLSGVEPKECKGSELFEFKAQFTRSLSDEFGAAIRGDIAALGASYFLIIIYMAVMLSQRDHVHSMVDMSLVTVAIVGASYIGCMGLGAYMGLMNNNLNAQIPFLLLGLGVDDAFVLVSEFVRANRANPTGSIEDRMGKALRGGGMSILITSVTDALAFFFGSITVLPALSWFCVFAGMGVVLCFLFQILLFVPFLVLNERRANANRYDLSCFPLGLCCMKATPARDKLCCVRPQAADGSPAGKGGVEVHEFENPRGCCFCCRGKDGAMTTAFEKFGRTVTTPVGKIVTMIIFFVILCVGIAGAMLIKQDFKLEWFVPDDSYLNTMFKWNEEYFRSGTPVTIFVKEMDYFKAQPKLLEIRRYLNTSDVVDPDKEISDWYSAFMDTARNDATNAPNWLTTDRKQFKDQNTFYTQLHEWYVGGGGARFRNSIKWVDADCDDTDKTAQCDPTAGVVATKMGCTLTLEATDKGPTRYATMQSMRSEVNKIMDDKAFPYSFQFLYWEETGVIGKELVQNLLSCGAVIIIIICLMIPDYRIAPFVVLCVFYTVITLVGFMHWWDITVSGVSTIYILISVGLAVDYAAHVAHMFVDSTGAPEDRAVKALARIGPSVFNAIGSTMLAVAVLGTSKSYIFRVFFKALFLTVLFGGMVGLWLLPVVLSLVGGSKTGEGEGDSPRGIKKNAVAATKEVELKAIEKVREVEVESKADKVTV